MHTTVSTFVPDVSLIKKSEDIYELTIKDKSTHNSWSTEIETYYWMSDLRIDKLDEIIKMGFKKTCTKDYNFNAFFELNEIEKKLKLTLAVEILSPFLKNKRDEKIFILNFVDNGVVMERMKLIKVLTESVGKEFGQHIVEEDSCEKYIDVFVEYDYNKNEIGTPYGRQTRLYNYSPKITITFNDEQLFDFRTRALDVLTESEIKFLSFILSNTTEEIVREALIKTIEDKHCEKLYFIHDMFYSSFDYSNGQFKHVHTYLNYLIKYVLTMYSISFIAFTEYGITFSYINKIPCERNIIVVKNSSYLPEECRYKILCRHYKGYIMIEFL